MAHMAGGPRTVNGLPAWVSIVVVLTVLGLMVYSVVKLGVDGFPITMMLGGLLGAYAGVDQIIKNRNG